MPSSSAPPSQSPWPGTRSSRSCGSPKADKLDDRSKQIVAEMAEKHGFQVFMEMVRGAGPAAVVIEDGEVVSPPCRLAE